VTYFYTVSAVSNNGNSAPSNEVSDDDVRGLGGSSGAFRPGGDGDLIKSDQPDLIDNASNETGFKIRRKAGIDGTWAQVATAGLNTTTYSDTSLNSSQTYYYTGQRPTQLATRRYRTRRTRRRRPGRRPRLRRQATCR
jgi:hypothetical protein